MTEKKEKTISDERLQEKIDWRPHPNQIEVIRVSGTLRIITLCCGRRWGKSALSAYIALKALLKDNQNIWIVAPSYDLTQKVFNYLVRWFAIVAPSQMKGITNRPVPRIVTARGSTLECKSAENPTSLLGEELDLMIVDEAAPINRRVWEQFLFPTLASRQGKVIFISTPTGRGTWFHEEYVKAEKLGGAFKFDSKDNPHFPKEEWERAKENLPDHVFRQEYQAEFLDDSSSVFRGIQDVIRDNISADVQKGRHYVMGVDLAKYKDFTVLTVVDKTSNTVVFIDRFKDIDWNLQKERIKNVAKRYNNARIYIDSTGVGDPITDDLRREGLMVDDMKYTNKSKQQLIEKLSIWIEQKRITIPKHDILINELEIFGYQITDNGTMTYGAPRGSHDDCVNSLMLAVFSLQVEASGETVLQKEMRKGAMSKKRSFI